MLYLPNYPNVTMLRSGLCYCKFVCRLEHLCTLLRGLKVSAIFLHHFVP